jgi:hypothetical protein
LLVACIIADNRCRVLHKILYQVLCKTPAAQQRAAGAFLSAVYSYGNTAQFPPDGLSTAPAAAARHLRRQNAR